MNKREAIERRYFIEATYLEVYEQAQEIIRCKNQKTPKRLLEIIDGCRQKVRHWEDESLKLEVIEEQD